MEQELWKDGDSFPSLWLMGGSTISHFFFTMNIFLNNVHVCCNSVYVNDKSNRI
jgi:hypothetical protein